MNEHIHSQLTGASLKGGNIKDREGASQQDHWDKFGVEHC